MKVSAVLVHSVTISMVMVIAYGQPESVSNSQTVFPDFTPTGYIREDAECTNAGNTPCNAIYQNYTKPSCTGCPLIQLYDCSGSQIVNCETSTDIEYAEAAFQFNTAQPLQPNPCTIVMAETAECIQAAVRKVRDLRSTREHSNLQLSIRGGRHSYIGASTVSKGVVIDISQFKAFVPSFVDDTVVMGVGNTLIEVYANLWNLTQSSLPQSLFPGGTCPTVGLSGLILGGGQGIVGRKHGLASDNILEYLMVNATGDILTVTNNTYPDLFWALRGGGNGNFGIVYQVTLQRFEIPEQNADIIVYYHTPGDWLEVFQAWQNYILSQYFIDREYIWAQLTITPTRLHVAAHASGNAAAMNDFLEHFQNTFINNLTNTTPSGYHSNSDHTICNYTPANYSGALAFWAGCTMENECGTNEDFERCLQLPTQCCGHPFNMNSGYQSRSNPLSTEGMQTVIDNILNVVNVAGCMNASVQMDSLGGRINAVNSDATAFPHRDNIFGYQYITYFVEPCNQTAMIQWLDRFYAKMTQFMGNGSYRNYANVNISTPNERYFLGNLDRLMDIKSVYDPENFFSYSQSIPPSMQPTLQPSMQPTGSAIQFQILSPLNQADERHPGVINVPIQITLVPVTSVLQNDIAVFVSVLGGTATADNDYTLDSGSNSLTLSFANGTANGAIENAPITVLDDLALEGTETIVLFASTQPELSASFVTGKNTIVISILDNDVIIGFQQLHYKVNEDDRCVTVCAEIVGGQLTPPDRVSISFLTESITAIAPMDYEPPPEDAVLTFYEGSMGQALCKEITIVDDNVTEVREEFTVKLNLVDEVGVDVQFLPVNTTVKITDGGTSDVAIASAAAVAAASATAQATAEASASAMSSAEAAASAQASAQSSAEASASASAAAQSIAVAVASAEASATASAEASAQALAAAQAIAVVVNQIMVSIENNVFCPAAQCTNNCECNKHEGTSHQHDGSAYMGGDPHFSIVLPDNHMLCYTVQGEPGLVFNLISNKHFYMNALFTFSYVERNATFIGALGIVLWNSSSDITKLIFNGTSKEILVVGDELLTLDAKTVQGLYIQSNGPTISYSPKRTGNPSVRVSLKNTGVDFTVRFTRKHLEMFWDSIGELDDDSHGLIGQFYHSDIQIDESERILVLPDKSPVPVRYRPVWGFMKYATGRDEHCWTTINTGMQGEGLIKGTYHDYVVSDILSTDFKFKPTI